MGGRRRRVTATLVPSGAAAPSEALLPSSSSSSAAAAAASRTPAGGGAHGPEGGPACSWASVIDGSASSRGADARAGSAPAVEAEVRTARSDGGASCSASSSAREDVEARCRAYEADEALLGWAAEFVRGPGVGGANIVRSLRGLCLLAASHPDDVIRITPPGGSERDGLR